MLRNIVSVVEQETALKTSEGRHLQHETVLSEMCVAMSALVLQPAGREEESLKKALKTKALKTPSLGHARGVGPQMNSQFGLDRQHDGREEDSSRKPSDKALKKQLAGF